MAGAAEAAIGAPISPVRYLAGFAVKAHHPSTGTSLVHPHLRGGWKQIVARMSDSDMREHLPRMSLRSCGLRISARGAHTSKKTVSLLPCKWMSRRYTALPPGCRVAISV